MPYLGLQPHVSFAMVDGRAVFLDLKRDRYLALSKEAAKAFSQLREQTSLEVTEEQAAPLLSTGLFELRSVSSKFDAAQTPLVDRNVPPGPTRLRNSDFVLILFLVIRARHAVQFHRLKNIVERRRCRASARDPAVSAEGVEDLAQRFRQVRALLPIRPKCLQDSLALFDWLAGRDVFATLVFGVKLDPFAAHCWVQFERTMLNDSPDRVSSFTPILVI